MRLRRRQKIRLLILASGLLVVAGVTLGAYHWRRWSTDREITERAVAARTALEAGEFETAVDGLGTYINRFRDREGVLTATDYRLYAKALTNLPDPDGGNTLGAIAALRQAANLEPADLDVDRELLDLYLAISQLSEAQATLDRLLAAQPGDTELLATEADLLARRKDWARALEVAERVREAEPDTLPPYLRLLELRIASGELSTATEAWIDETAGSHAGSTKFELFRAFALNRLSEISRADTSLAARADTSLDAIRTSGWSPADETQLQMLVALLDSKRRFDDSLDALETALRTTTLSAGADTRRELMRRLWYAGRTDRLLEVANAWKATGGIPGGEARVLFALALHARGNDDASRHELELLRSDGSAVAADWAELAAYLLRAGGLADAEPHDTITAVAQRLSAVPLVWMTLGDAHAAAGEWYLAEDAWGNAARGAPSWSAPLRRIASALLDSGRRALAPAVAEEALRRSPNDVAAFELYLRTLAANAERMSEQRREQLVGWLHEISAKQTGAAKGEVEALEIEVLLQADAGAVGPRLETLLDSSPRASEQTLLRLARIADQAHTDLAPRFHALCRKLHGLTPRLAFAIGTHRALSAGAEAGMRSFTRLRDESQGDGDDLAWDLARCALAESLGDASAASLWVRAADTHADEMRAQLGALASSVAWTDKEGMRRTIDRVRTLGGRDGIAWQLARARWLLRFGDGSEDAASDAAAMLRAVVERTPRSIEAHTMLATALERLGKLDLAEQELRRAEKLSPGNTAIMLDIARLAARQGRPDSARTLVEKVLGSGDLDSAQISRAAYVLASQGAYRRSIGVLEGLPDDAHAPRAGVLLLAQLYARVGQYDRALTLCKRLMRTPDVPSISLMAALLAATGRRADADVALSRLDSLRIADADRSLVRARFAARFDTEKRALSLFARAAAAAPDREDIWREYLTFAVSRGVRAHVERIMDDENALALPIVQACADHREVVLSALDADAQRGVLLDALVPGNDAIVVFDAITMLQRGADDPLPPGDLAAALRTRSDAHPELLSLQLLAAHAAANVADLRSACRIARRATARHTTSVSAARLSAQLLAASGRWSEAVDAAMEWRSRSGVDTREADALLGDALVRSGQADKAVALLEPAAKLALQRGDAADDGGLVSAYAIALLRAGDADGMRAVVGPLAASSAAWRKRLLQVSPRRFADGDELIVWIDSVSASVPDTAVSEALSVAGAWCAAWESARERELAGAERLKQRADAALEGLTTHEDAPADAFFAAGTVALDENDHATAEAAFREALRRDPGNVAARNNLAMTLAEDGRWQDAVVEAKVALDAVPSSPELLDTLAFAYLRGEQYEDAKTTLESAVRLAPNDVGFLLNLCEAYLRLDRTRDASRTLARAADAIEQGANATRDERGRMDALRRELD